MLDLVARENIRLLMDTAGLSFTQLPTAERRRNWRSNLWPKYRHKVKSNSKRSFRRSPQIWATIPICLTMETVLGATAFLAWGDRNWDGIGILGVAAAILLLFPYGVFWVTNVGDPRRQERGEAQRETEQSA